MSSFWDYGSSSQSDSPREFFVTCQFFVSNAAALNLRKSRKKSEKRDTLIVGVPDDPRKVKEKSSFHLLSRNTTGTGYWRETTCKLSEDKGRCFLSLYLDNSILYQTVNLHLLNQTDIRVIDNSLFFRKNCIGLYGLSNKRQTSAETNDPIFLLFSNPDLCNTWLVLLKSYAVPEIYGQRLYYGGSYRMWRQVEVTVMQGRNLGNTKPHESGTGADANEQEFTDYMVSCDVALGDTICGRTTSKRGLVSPIWHETIVLSDLPPFTDSDHLEIKVWKERKSTRGINLGAVKIALKFLPHLVDQGWFPVLQSLQGVLPSEMQAGELQLKLRVDQEIILPQVAYTRLLKTLNSRNYFDWLSEFESKLKLTNFAMPLVSIASANGSLVEQVQEYAEREMERTPFSQETLFRGNTTLTRTMETCMVWYGKAFLEASVGNIIRKICDDGVEIHLERTGKGGKDMEKNVDMKQLRHLLDLCKEIWGQIYSVRAECPEELRKLFGTIRKLVERRLRMDDTWQQKYANLPWQSVSAFCFLRFIVPAILHPHLFGIHPGIPSLSVKRTLTLIARVIQSLANFSSVSHKEDFMSTKEIEEFLRESRKAMIDYLMVVSGDASVHSKQHGDSRDRLVIINALRQRSVLMTPLEREAIPVLPHFSDIPRLLAVIASGVYRQVQYLKRKSEAILDDHQALKELCSRCLEVQQEATLRMKGSDTSKIPELNTMSIQGPSRFATVGVNDGTPPLARNVSTRRQTFAGDMNRNASLMNQLSLSSKNSSGQDERQQIIHFKSPSSDSIPSVNTEKDNMLSRLGTVDLTTDLSDDAGRKKKTLRGILRR
ncbi:hypothetical protein AMATHDRAFT_54 [Amanita thiersii Skay4041]|uniref:Uncharacterized protein n=1 Tax=Amanita thiersii Skay4041 TaxID=703135 RepID=A0A2A9P1A8_9AGAR|nr:hypothetical protein AMATHDRAFT_54 [Amanita thiersii Skay4041]